VNIIVLAAGGNLSREADSEYPIWLSEIDGELLIQRQARSLAALQGSRCVYVFRREDQERYHLRGIVSQLTSDSVVVEVGGETAGAACTALLTMAHIEMEGELVIANATDQIDADFRTIISGFRAKGADAGVLTFPSLHPRYSYVQVDEEGWVVESAEKRPISRSACAGFYWFRRAADFFQALENMILKDAHVGGKFYICPSLNELILRQKRIAIALLQPDQYHPVKSTRHVDAYGRSLENLETS
jgi:hypothetical protein